MLRVIANGEQGYTLETSQGVSVGWVGAHVIGFRIFERQHDAMEAAPSAWETLQTALGWPPNLRMTVHPQSRTADILARAGAVGELRVIRDGAYDWIARGNVPLARLHTTVTPQLPKSDGPLKAAYAIEFVLPSSTSEAVAINAAQSMFNTLRRWVQNNSEPLPTPA